jgi:hypothetical protein
MRNEAVLACVTLFVMTFMLGCPTSREGDSSVQNRPERECPPCECSQASTAAEQAKVAPPPAPATPEDATVFDIVTNRSGYDGKVLRVRGALCTCYSTGEDWCTLQDSPDACGGTGSLYLMRGAKTPLDTWRTVVRQAQSRHITTITAIGVYGGDGLWLRSIE